MKTFPKLGFHYYPDDRHFTDQDLSTWLPILASLGARWLTVKGSVRRAIPENFLRGLAESGIEPIIHIPHPVGQVDDKTLRPILEAYARWGVRFVIIFDRPNNRQHWANQSWHKKGLVERFVDIALPTLDLVRSSGLAPVLPPLEPGGDYWDTAFLEGVLRSIQRRQHRSLLRDLNISFYAWTNKHPIEWGKGGPEMWDNPQPYSSGDEAQDHRGFRIFDWYHAIATQTCGELIPLICVAGGINLRSTPVSPDQHQETTHEILNVLEQGDIPTTVRNFNFYLLASEESHADYVNAWFPATSSPIPSVNEIRSSIALNSDGQMKPLRHYLLLPEGSEVHDVTNHNGVANLLQVHSPVVGHSPFEAQLAQTVTLFGAEDQIDLNVQKDLEKAGCTVKRIFPATNQGDRSDLEVKSKEERIQEIIDRIVSEKGES
jgi:hypothetical protein